jgi:hypothetical protein
MKFLEKLFSKRQRSQYDGENAVLVQAMEELARKNDPENLKKMYEALLTSRLLVPTPELPCKELDGNVELQLVFINGQQGKLTPVFTDIEALRNYDPNTPCLSVAARPFFEFVSNRRDNQGVAIFQGVVINPPSIRKLVRIFGLIPRTELEVLARGLVPAGKVGGLVPCAIPAAGAGGLIHPLNETLPSAVAEALRKSAVSVPEVATLYVFLLEHTHGSPQLTVGVGFDTKVTKERVQLIVQTLWKDVAPSLTELKTLDFVAMNGQIAAQAESAGDKIYQRL